MASKPRCVLPLALGTEKKNCKTSAQRFQLSAVHHKAEHGKQSRKVLQPLMGKPWASTRSEPKVIHLQVPNLGSKEDGSGVLFSSLGFART